MIPIDSPAARVLAVVTCLVVEVGCRQTSSGLSPSYSEETAPKVYNFRNLTADIHSVFGTSDGKRLWAVGDKGTILESSDGEHWNARISGTTSDLSSVFGTSDGKRLWAVGVRGTILVSRNIGTAPFIREAHLSSDWTSRAVEVQLDIEAPRGTEKVAATGLNEYEFSKGEDRRWQDLAPCMPAAKVVGVELQL